MPIGWSSSGPRRGRGAAINGCPPGEGCIKENRPIPLAFWSPGPTLGFRDRSREPERAAGMPGRREGPWMNANLRNFALWVIIVLFLLALFTLFQNPGQRSGGSVDIPFSQFLSEVDQGRVRDVTIQGPEIQGHYNSTDSRSFSTYAPNDPTLVQKLYSKGVSITARPLQENVPWFVSLLVSWLPFIALIGVWIFLSRQMQGGAGKAMGFGKSRAKMLTEP